VEVVSDLGVWFSKWFDQQVWRRPRAWPGGKSVRSPYEVHEGVSRMSEVECEQCEGSGVIECGACDEDATDCVECGASGTYECDACGGEGTVDA